MTFFNPVIKTITPYVAGKPIEELARESGMAIENIIKLASNENPLGPSPKALNAIKGALTNINRYPDSNYYLLRNKLAKSLKVDMAKIVLGNGSDELIDCVIKSFSSPGDEVLSAKSTFLEYEIIAKVNNRKFKAVALKDLRYDLDAIRKAITKNTKLIFIANPNNPTGTYLEREEVENFLKRIPEGIITIFDEAYNEFVDSKNFPQTLKFIKKYNLIVLRTFSKIYGLAGLRIGFALCRDGFASVMNTVRQPFNVNSLAAAAALAAIDDCAFVRKSQQLIWQEKKAFYANFNKLGVKFIPSAANFILIEAKNGSQAFFKRMLNAGIIVRAMDAYGLKNYVRVTIGTPKENRRFIGALKKIKEIK